jgi:hypothetical protein
MVSLWPDGCGYGPRAENLHDRSVETQCLPMSHFISHALQVGAGHMTFAKVDNGSSKSLGLGI